MTAVLESSCLVERLREVGDFENGHAVQIMPPVSYLHSLLYEGNTEKESGLTSDIVLIYKLKTKTSSSSLPLDVRDEGIDPVTELDGNPLPAPFGENDDFDVSVSETKEFQWPKGELNHYPLKIGDSLKILNDASGATYGISTDIWCLVDGGIKNECEGSIVQNQSLNGSKTFNGLSMLDVDVSNMSNSPKINENVRILLGLHASGCWWSRSFVESQGVCSTECPEMDPLLMKKNHMAISNVQEFKVNVNVLCRFNVVGKHITSEDCASDNAYSVSLELMWRQPTLSVPAQVASVQVCAQVVVGNKSRPTHDLWKELCVLNSLFDLLVTCWTSNTSPELLPHLDLASEDLEGDTLPLQSRIKTLIVGGKQALQAENANRRMSLAPSLLARQSVAPSLNSRQSMAPGFLGRKSLAPQAKKESDEKESRKLSLSDAVEIVTAGNRENSDVIDGLFSLLLECKTYRELISAWDFTFMELNDARQPYIRPKNSSRAARLIQGFVSGHVESSPDFLGIEGSLTALELLIEMGLEKLMTDYYYIFAESQLVGREELQAPPLVRAGLGVPRNKWLLSCGQLLGWLAQVHCALEIVLPLQEPMSESGFPSMVSQALKFYQSELSPVRSVTGLLTPGNLLQEFSWKVSNSEVYQHTNRKFDWWRMTLTSETATRRVRSVFLRSLQPIFPPQICEYNTTHPDLYHCAEAVTISDKF